MTARVASAGETPAGGADQTAQVGTVYLVGGGPGDPGLMTVRATQLIASADAILYDRLIPETALATARPDALKEFAGKGPRGDSKLQPEIEARMVELAREGKTVVRLKGGDPFVFGRGGEEAATLAAAGIPFEIVPGVTAGVAAAAYAGIPVTHRDHAAAVAFVTGQENPEKPDSSLDWDALARFPGTLVFYMGVKNLPDIATRLIAGGRPADQPVAVIARGTTAAQHTVTGPLDRIAALVAEADVQPPALTVVGDVVGEREHIEWFERRPLSGRTVAVTRARPQAGRLATMLSALGAAVVQTPTIQIQPRDDDSVRALATRVAAGDAFDLICFTSANGVDAFFTALAGAGADARALAGARLAAVGSTTAGALREHGLIAEFVPERATAEGLLELLAGQELSGLRILVAVAAAARPVLAQGLTDCGGIVERVDLYDTIAEPLDAGQISALVKADFVTFASGSAVRSLIESLGGIEPLQNGRLISIGPITSSALRENGLQPTIEAERHDIEGLVDALLSSALDK